MNSNIGNKKVTLILTVGISDEPIIKSIEKQFKQFHDSDIYLLYGAAFPGQYPDPMAISQRCREKAIELGVNNISVKEISMPEDLSKCIEEIRNVFDAIETDLLIVNFTGGSKPMASALVHVALSGLYTGEVVLDYVGGKVRDENGRVIRKSMEITRKEQTYFDELCNQILNNLKTYKYSKAKSLAEQLPEKGQGFYVKGLTNFLNYWDKFLYEEAMGEMRKIASIAQTYHYDHMLCNFSKIIEKMSPYVVQVTGLIRKLKRHDAQEHYMKDDIAIHRILVADTVENSHRRLFNNNPQDSVLRIYRAIEVSIHLKLFEMKINPANKKTFEQLDKHEKDKFFKLSGLSSVPSFLALFSGLAMCKTHGLEISTETEAVIKDIANARNNSYLEHGYNKITIDQAESLFQKSNMVISSIIGDISKERKEISLRVN